MGPVYFLSNLTKLRQLGTTNFFRAIYNTDSCGVVSCIRVKNNLQDTKLHNHQMIFTKIESEDIPNLPTITELLVKLKQRDMLENPEVIREILAKSNGMVRAELEVTDYRTNGNSRYFKVDYQIDTIIPENRIITYTDGLFEEEQLMNAFTQLSAQPTEPELPIQISSTEQIQKSIETSRKQIVGF